MTLWCHNQHVAAARAMKDWRFFWSGKFSATLADDFTAWPKVHGSFSAACLRRIQGLLSLKTVESSSRTDMHSTPALVRPFGWTFLWRIRPTESRDGLIIAPAVHCGSKSSPASLQRLALCRQLVALKAVPIDSFFAARVLCRVQYRVLGRCQK